MPDSPPTNPELTRLADADAPRHLPWKKWGPYLSERQWGTVREDYSPNGSAWTYLPHDHARSRAYRWGEDGIAGISDDFQRLCLSFAFWNGKDPILKERLFGLTGPEGNHGEDVKELYYYLDNTPSHSYMKMLYKYPHSAYPYDQLVQENARRTRHDPEFELIDTGIFDQDRYFDIVIEYAKADCEDILINVTVQNRGPDAATLHVLPQLFFRNTWSWCCPREGDVAEPEVRASSDHTIAATHPQLGQYTLHCDGAPTLLFTHNETNTQRLFGTPPPRPFVKDAFHDYVIHNNHAAVNADKAGTKAAAHFILEIPGQDAKTLRLRLRHHSAPAAPAPAPFDDFEAILHARRTEADLFYADFQKDLPTDDARHVQRLAAAGLLWSKQFYNIDIPTWLDGDDAQPPPPESRKHGRNASWDHLNTQDILSMPDKWEYPWFAAWDLAFHCIPLAYLDSRFAKHQLTLLTREWYMHPNGQLPAYEWHFGDVNPPVHAWAAYKVFKIDRKRTGGDGDLVFLERVFHKLLLNFTWWVNRKDLQGLNIFQGGFLGLDNVGVFDRSAPLPTGGHISQADGTAWMAMYCLNMLQIALELAQKNTAYEDLATKFFEHFLHIAGAMANMGEHGISLWDEPDQFFYDVLSLPNGHAFPMKIRSIVGLIPLFAVEVIQPSLLAKLPHFRTRLEWFLAYRPDLAGLVSRWWNPGCGETKLLSLLRGHRMKAILKRMLDENEFLSPFGVRSMSKIHQDHPYSLTHDGNQFTVTYQPGEGDSELFGGNSNWRGPVWICLNYLIVQSLKNFHRYYGEDFLVECPTGSNNYLNLNQIADFLRARMATPFLADSGGHRPILNQHPKTHTDPHFKDHVLFYEYIHADTGRGCGASHQTGWTGLITSLLFPID